MVRIECNNLLFVLLLQSKLTNRYKLLLAEDLCRVITWRFAAKYHEDSRDEVRSGVVEDRKEEFLWVTLDIKETNLWRVSVGRSDVDLVIHCWNAGSLYMRNHLWWCYLGDTEQTRRHRGDGYTDERFVREESSLMALSWRHWTDPGETGHQGGGYTNE